MRQENFDIIPPMLPEARKRILLPTPEWSPRQMGLPQGVKRGRYVGIVRTDQSAVGMGQMAVTIGDQSILLSEATGLDVLRYQFLIRDFRVMPPGEIAKLLPDPETSGRYSGSRYLNNRTILIFLKDTTGDIPALTILDSQRNSPILLASLYSPDQVKRGFHEEAINNLERKSNNIGATPRISSRGRAPRIMQRLFSR